MMQGHSFLLMVMSGMSLVTFVVSLVTVPWIIGRMPADYFLRAGKCWHTSPSRQVRFFTLIARNCFGILLLAAGIIMLVTPGQGLLTILLGFLIMDFPGKRDIEHWLLKRKGLRRALNWVRKKQGQPPMVFYPPDKNGD